MFILLNKNLMFQLYDEFSKTYRKPKTLLLLSKVWSLNCSLNQKTELKRLRLNFNKKALSHDTIHSQLTV